MDMYDQNLPLPNDSTTYYYRLHFTIFLRLGFPSGSMVKNPPAMQELQVQSLGWEDPLEKGLATHSSVLAWRIPWRQEPGGLQSMGSQRVRHD